LILALICSVLLIPIEAQAEEKNREDLYTLALGGRAYDNWMGLLSYRDLSLRNLDKRRYLMSHPLYPKEGAKRGLTTWRCKECHGWDYRGADGAYGTGSHATGIKGVRHMVGKDPAQVIAIIRNKLHRYNEKMIDPETAEALAMFITKGQVDMTRHINDDTKKIRGNPKRGEPSFQAVCAICHGMDGRKINFKTVDRPEFLGTVTRHNPWEAFHKIRNGHPGKDMVSMRAIPIQAQVDILAYIRANLPER
ncbi:MAG: c-type cytochrome, partial [Magnetococcales bacterium]|nr:c-type cytochrome [Magnetococcales bacterium]